jgi:hypothetical protein
MGASGTKKAVKPELSQTKIEYLKTRTRMSEEEIQKWFSKLNKESFFLEIILFFSFRRFL